MTQSTKICNTVKQYKNGNTKNGGYHDLICDVGVLRLYFITHDMVRFRFSFDGKFTESSYVFALTAWDDQLDDFFAQDRQKVNPIAVDVQDNKTHFQFVTKTITINVYKSPFGVTIYDKDGDLLHKDLKGRTFVKDHLGRVYHYSERKQNDKYYGFGESAGLINKSGTRQRMNPKDALGYDAEKQNALYKHIPFYIRLDDDNQKASGVFYHNLWASELDMGAEHSNYWNHYRYFVADGGDIDWVFINGPSLKAVIRRYTDLTGKTYLQPKNSLGYLGSSMYYPELEKDCDHYIMGFVEKAKKEKIPLDSFHLSTGYTVGKDGLRYYFTWNKKRFPDPKRFFTFMEKCGVPVVPNIKPGILKTHPYYNDFVKSNAFLKTSDGKHVYHDIWWGGTGAFFDFTSPKGRGVWKDMIKKHLMAYGSKAVWNDNCEFDLTDPMALCAGDGMPRPAGSIKAIFPNLMSKMGHEVYAQEQKDVRPLIVCRSGGPGIQRYAQTWCGDNLTNWHTLKYNIATVLGLGLSGVANQGADVGAFWGKHPEKELLVRWVQNGIFMPRFSVHSCNTNSTVTELWMYPDVTDIIRTAIELRYALFPYFYALLYNASVHGDPMMRPMFYEFQNDRQTYDESIQFMLGRDILVANVVDEGATRITVYLPTGTDWYHWETREKFSGGQYIHMDVDINSIPMFLRSGSVVPMTRGLTSLNKQNVNNYRIIMTPRNEQGNEKRQFTLYEDDGVSNDYKNGDYLATTLTCTYGENMTIEFKRKGSYNSTVETMELEIINTEQSAYWVDCDGQRFEQYLDFDKWHETSQGWIYDYDSKSVRIKYPNIQGDYSVVVNFGHFDLIGMTIDDD